MIMNKPTTKTVNLLKYLTYARHMKENLQELFEFHRSEIAKNKLERYQGLQRARDKMANVLVNSGRKYNNDKKENTKKIEKEEMVRTVV